jgi:glycosyltransferase involved in cell wall biosynthesis
MQSKSTRKIVIINQASNYLTVDLCNAFYKRFDEVILITGSIRIQGDELNPGITVRYIHKWVDRPAHKKLISYLLAMWKFFWLILIKYRKHEVFFVSIPPMAYLLNIILPNRFSMLIWDVFPDSFKITGMKESHILYRVWAYLNKISFKKAFKIFTIGEKLADLIENYINRDKIIIQPIWSIFQSNERVPKESNQFIEEHQLKGKFIIQYSGNIGLAHKVELVIELAEKMTEYPNILFQIIGRGPRKPLLEKLVQQKQLPNCQFLPFQSEETFPLSLSAADLGVVILDEETSKGSVPSKSYNLMSFGIPSLYIAGKDCELYDYTQKYNHGECFSEKDLLAAKEYILSLAKDVNLYNKYSQNAEKAAAFFKRNNADKIVEYYLQDK